MESSQLIQMLTAILQQRIAEGEIDVPMLPKVASRVIHLTQDANSDAEDLARLIQSDQPLAGHVMRIANSAIYSPNSTLVSLQQAIARLGMQIISDIALAASINSKMFNAPGYNGFIAQQLKFSLHCGVWAKEVARACRRNVEAAFLAGLLHDIGRPVAIQTVLDIAQYKSVKLSRHDLLSVVATFDSELSVKVVRNWEMPSIVCEIVEHFADYQNAGKAREQTMIALAGTKFAAQFSKIEGRIAQRKEDFLGNHVFGDLNLYHDDIERLTERADSINTTVEAIAA